MTKFHIMTKLGYSLTPLHPRSKIPLLRGWNTQKHADCDQIDRWIAEHKGCNFGVRTDGLFIIDIDDPQAEWFQENNWILDENPMMVKTKRGWHLYYQTMEKQAQKKMAEGVDVRTSGLGFVVAPGSVVDEWEYDEHVFIRKSDLPVIPDSLLMTVPNDDLFTSPSSPPSGSGSGSKPNGEGGLIRAFSKGERNNGLARVAGRVFALLYNEIDYDFLLIFLHTVNRYKCDPPLDDAEVNKIAHSIYRRESDNYNVAKGMLSSLNGKNSFRRV